MGYPKANLCVSRKTPYWAMHSRPRFVTLWWQNGLPGQSIFHRTFVRDSLRIFRTIAVGTVDLIASKRSTMSHHLDSPIARQDIRLDITDLYVFRGQTGTVFVINVCHSIFGPIPVHGYHPEGMYEFKIDSNGDAVEEITYRLTFDERDKNDKQRFVVRRITGTE